MCELLAAMRRIPIEPPGGLAPALGAPANPTYSVSVTEGAAIAARAQHDSEEEGKRLFPSNGGLHMLDSEGATTGFLNPAAEMMVGVTGRRGSAMSSQAAAAATEAVLGKRVSMVAVGLSREGVRRSSLADLERGGGRSYGTVTYSERPRH